MANPRMTLLDLLSKAEQGADPDFLRDGLKLLAQELMDAEGREWDTRVGSIELDIPKLRAGTYFPSLLELRRRHERALLSVVQEAYIHGVSIRAVDALAEALSLQHSSRIVRWALSTTPLVWGRPARMKRCSGPRLAMVLRKLKDLNSWRLPVVMARIGAVGPTDAAAVDAA